MLTRFGLYLLLLLGLASCNIKEDMSNCPGTILLDYTAYPDEILDDIKPDEKVNIYIFDRDGVCDRIYRFTYGELEQIGFEFQVPIQYRDCSAVVWHGNNSTDYLCENMVEGQNLHDFDLKLVTNTIGHQPAPLWASPLEPIDYCASKSRHRIHMTRIHTYINVHLRQKLNDGSTKEVNMDDYITTVTSENNAYITDYTVCNKSIAVKFNNTEELAKNTFLDWAHVGTLRVMPDMYCKLTVAPIDAPYNPIMVGGTTHFDLVKYMLQSRQNSRAVSEGLSDQRFLDLNKVWDLDLLIKNGVAISLTINGWTIWLDDVELN